jgi:hypothetical protein
VALGITSAGQVILANAAFVSPPKISCFQISAFCQVLSIHSKSLASTPLKKLVINAK